MMEIPAHLQQKNERIVRDEEGKAIACPDNDGVLRYISAITGTFTAGRVEERAPHHLVDGIALNVAVVEVDTVLQELVAQHV
jgi:hypothetical protein